VTCCQTDIHVFGRFAACCKFGCSTRLASGRIQAGDGVIIIIIIIIINSTFFPEFSTPKKVKVIRKSWLPEKCISSRKLVATNQQFNTIQNAAKARPLLINVYA